MIVELKLLDLGIVDTLVSVGEPTGVRRRRGDVPAQRPRSVERQPFGAGARRSLAAIVTRSARERASIFRITWPRCAFTVISLMPSSPPTCLFNRPETTNAMTSRSRRLSVA